MQTTSIISLISNWLKNYALSCKSDGFVIGISGGIDSAVTSVLAAKTGLPLICIEMPIHQNREQIEISKFYERLPKPHSIAVKELEDEQIYIAHKEKEDDIKFDTPDSKPVIESKASDKSGEKSEENKTVDKSEA